MTEAAEQVQPRRSFSISGCIVWVLAGIMFVVFLIALIPNIVASYAIPLPPALGQLLATSQTVYSTSVPAQRQPVAQPVVAPPITGGAAPWPTLTPTQEVSQPTLTLPPLPTATASFWTPEEQTQIAATATAFIEVIPTAEPAFVEYATKACSDPELVAESATLQLFCRK